MVTHHVTVTWELQLPISFACELKIEPVDTTVLSTTLKIQWRRSVTWIEVLLAC